MGRILTWRKVRIAVLAAAVAIPLGSVAWGQPAAQYDDDDYYYRHDEAREHGYRNGYRDGLNAGQYDRERGRRFHFKNDDWEDSRGFEHWMGNKGHYKRAYREAYERGYRRGYGYYGDRDWDRDGYRYHDRDDWR
jgi:hypothetical protein